MIIHHNPNAPKITKHEALVVAAWLLAIGLVYGWLMLCVIERYSVFAPAPE